MSLTVILLVASSVINGSESLQGSRPGASFLGRRSPSSLESLSSRFASRRSSRVRPSHQNNICRCRTHVCLRSCLAVASLVRVGQLTCRVVWERPPRPGPVISEEYHLEYGTDRLEMHVGAVQPGQRVLLVRCRGRGMPLLRPTPRRFFLPRRAADALAPRSRVRSMTSLRREGRFSPGPG